MATDLGGAGAAVFGDIESPAALALAGDQLQRGALVAGTAGAGGDDLLEALVRLRLDALAEGTVAGPLVVLDPTGDLFESLCSNMPVSLGARIRLLDLSSRERVPALNLLDPGLFPDGTECAEALVSVLRHSWDYWGSGVEELLRRGLEVLHAWNRTSPVSGDHLGFLDLPLVLWAEEAPLGSFNRRVALSLLDGPLRGWYGDYLDAPEGRWARELRQVRSWLESVRSRDLPSAALGQRRSLVSIEPGRSDVLLVNLALGVVGRDPGGLMGAALAGLAMRACVGSGLVVCPDFYRLPGVDWSGLAERCAAGELGLLLGAVGLGGWVESLSTVAAGWRGNAFVFRVPPAVAGVMASLFPEDGNGTGPTDHELTGLRDGVCAVRLFPPGGGAPLVGRMRSSPLVRDRADRVDLGAGAAAHSWSRPLGPV